jgi:hypothetical protein
MLFCVPFGAFRGPLALQLCHFYGCYYYTKLGRYVQYKSNNFIKKVVFLAGDFCCKPQLDNPSEITLRYLTGQALRYSGSLPTACRDSGKQHGKELWILE